MKGIKKIKDGEEMYMIGIKSDHAYVYQGNVGGGKGYRSYPSFTEDGTKACVYNQSDAFAKLAKLKSQVKESLIILCVGRK